MPSLLTSHVFKTHQIHAIPCARHHTNITHRIQREEFRKGNGLVHEVNGGIFEGAEFAVDAADELVDEVAQVAVFFDLTPRRNCNLDQDNLAHPLRMRLQQYLKRAQFLRDAFDVVEPVDADHDFRAGEFGGEGGKAGLDGGSGEGRGEVGGFDANWEGGYGDAAVMESDGGGGCRETAVIRYQYERA